MPLNNAAGNQESGPGESDVDVVVVGGGAAGLTASLVLGRQQRRVLLCDTGHPRNAPAQEMHMYLGFDGRPPADLRALGAEEAAAHDNVERTQLAVSGVSAGATGGLDLALADGSTVRTKRMLLACGLSDQLSSIDGVGERFGAGVFHCPFCHGYEVLGRSIAVLTDDPAIPQQPAMQALYLATHFSDEVTLLTNGHELDSSLAAKLASFGIAVDDRKVTGLAGTDGDLTVSFAEGSLDVGAVFHTPREIGSTFAEELGLDRDDTHILVDSQWRTSNPLIFAAGDAALRRTDEVPLTFVAQAVAAGQAAAVWIDQDLFLEEAGLR